MNQDPTPHLEQYATYQEARREFHQIIPERFNIATAICRRQTDAVTRVALNEVRPAAGNIYTLGALDYFSDKFATALTQSGIAQGDVVAVMLGQSAALAVAHLGALKLGAIVQPLAVDADPTQIMTFLEDSRARAIVVEEEIRDTLVDAPRSVTVVFVASDNIHGHITAGQDRSFWREVYDASSDFKTAATASHNPAFIFSTSAARGSITSTIHSHGALIGNLPAFEMVNDFDLGPDAVLWTSSDWASIGTLLGVIYPAWYYGVPVIAHGPSNLTGDGLLKVLESLHVTVVQFPPPHLRSIKDVYPEHRDKVKLKLKRLIAAEPPSPEIVEWARTSLAASVNTVHSSVEACAFAATCERWFTWREGSVGRPVPGRGVEILDVDGNPLPPGERGRIAIGLPDPSVFLEHSRQTRTALDGKWFVSEEFGLKDSNGDLIVLP
jgi:acetyl-CoA synthetase